MAGLLPDIQSAFTAHLRDPSHHPAPGDIEDRRVQIYRDLLYNNVENLLSISFPVLRQIISDVDWHAMIHDYFKCHYARTPFFVQVPQEFIYYLEHERDTLENDPAYLLDLAHYEWSETAVMIDTREIDISTVDIHGDLLTGIPIINPLLRLLVYQWPVHKIGPDYQPDATQSETTFLAIFRRRNDDVSFLVLNAATARLLEHITNSQDCSGEALLQKIAAELNHPDPQQMLVFGSGILQELKAKEIILGVAI